MAKERPKGRFGPTLREGAGLTAPSTSDDLGKVITDFLQNLPPGVLTGGGIGGGLGLLSAAVSPSSRLSDYLLRALLLAALGGGAGYGVGQLSRQGLKEQVTQDVLKNYPQASEAEQAGIIDKSMEIQEQKGVPIDDARQEAAALYGVPAVPGGPAVSVLEAARRARQWLTTPMGKATMSPAAGGLLGHALSVPHYLARARAAAGTTTLGGSAAKSLTVRRALRGLLGGPKISGPLAAVAGAAAPVYGGVRGAIDPKVYEEAQRFYSDLAARHGMPAARAESVRRQVKLENPLSWLTTLARFGGLATGGAQEDIVARLAKARRRRRLAQDPKVQAATEYLRQLQQSARERAAAGIYESPY